MQTALTLQLNPIGFLRSTRTLKFDAPHQPDPLDQEQSVIELAEGVGFEAALSDLEGFDRIWLVWWFHRNESWRPMVLPPRGGNKRRGVFATRSPHRPNPLGLSCVTLHEVRGRTLVIGAHDLIDGTPILDIKPYIPKVDAFPNVNAGWTDSLEHELAPTPSYRVCVAATAQAQLDWLKTHWEIDFIERAKKILERDPTPHRTRRITKARDGVFRMGCGAWRLYFLIEGATVLILRVTPGYPPRLLEGDGPVVPHREAQIEFSMRWGNPSTPQEVSALGLL